MSILYFLFYKQSFLQTIENIKMCMKILWNIYYNRFIESIWISFFFRFENTVKRIKNRIEFLDDFPNSFIF